jgi:GntR family transcriptional regulator
MEQYNVSRTTIRQSIRDLAQNGVLETRRGAPTKVRHVPEKDMSNPGVFHHEIGSQFTVKLIRSVESKDFYLAKAKLHLEDHKEVFMAERLRLSKGLPIGYQQLFFPLAVADLMKGDLEDSFDLFPRLGQKNIHYTNIKEGISAVSATQYEAGLLGIMAGEPLIDITRTTLGGDSEPMEYSRTKYIPSAFDYRVEIGN